jgi:hypothetical protein
MYTALKNIQLGQLVNMIGIVTTISEPSRTKTGGMYQFISHKYGPSYQVVLRLDAFCPYR